MSADPDPHQNLHEDLLLGANQFDFILQTGSLALTSLAKNSLFKRGSKVKTTVKVTMKKYSE